MGDELGIEFSQTITLFFAGQAITADLFFVQYFCFVFFLTQPPILNP